MGIFPPPKFFSMIPKLNEQTNDLVKVSGGAIELTENPASFQKWMLAGYEQARVLREFEMQYSPQINQKFSHIEERKKKLQEASSYLGTNHNIEEMGNPFLDGTPEQLGHA